jgi:hypothetical protein
MGDLLHFDGAADVVIGVVEEDYVVGLDLGFAGE